jgi:hypothetical protein
MTRVLLQTIPLALAAFTPTMVLVIIVLLGTERGLIRAWAVVVGRFAAHLATAFALVYVFEQAEPEVPSALGGTRLTAVLYIGSGILLLMAASWMIFQGPITMRSSPRLADLLNAGGPFTLAAVNFGIVLVSLRLLALVAAGAANISASDINEAGRLVATIVLAVAMVLLLALPLIVYMALGERGPRVMNAVRVWMIRHQKPINVFSLIFIGLGLLVAGFARW